ncbi:hypothetical protein BCR44DRAFT_1261207 [Catenaria anguillulae PL171]|uniref:intramembrane prenyl-peptidase Rce1 n=1 Tax=Catenaria anguillulae PL171 TaxID=765915 RepID=A0A1Y2HF20_9FUNG|nr:hypothetical protein BCR44DRAFT_1261207 [Catenaria anguillulae PL171]
MNMNPASEDASSTRPLLSVTDATILATSLSVLYILGYYLAIRARHRRRRSASSAPGVAVPPTTLDDEDDETSEEAVIRSRLITIVATCFVATGLVYWTVYRRSVKGAVNISDFMSQMGIRWAGILPAIALPTLLIVTLFLGPLVQMYMERELFFQDRLVLDLFLHRIRSPHGQRSYFLGPICEEYIFRACIILPYYHAGVSAGNIVAWTPLFFGSAHLHNIFDIYRRMGRDWQALKRGVVASLFQFTYTTLFGWIVAWVYVRTGHVISVMLMHMFCNVMGVPHMHEVHLTRRPQVVWAAYVVGLVLFLLLAGPFTNPVLYSNTMFVHQ